MNAPVQLDPVALQQWMTAYIATVTGISSDIIRPAEPMRTYDLDSLDAVEMALDFERMYGLAVHPEFFMDGAASIESLVESLCRSGAAF